MDPVLIPMLLDTIDLLYSKNGTVTLADMNVKRRVSKRRFGEVGRVLENLHVAQRDKLSLVPGPDLEVFVKYWEKADLKGINDLLCRYYPYERFLNYLTLEKVICLPEKKDPVGRDNFTAELKARNIDLTFVAIDTFQWWGLVVGQVYLSHIGDGYIYWGGEQPDSETFESVLIRHYEQIRPLDGFANVGHLADRVCRELHISFVTFEKFFVQESFLHTGKYITATSLIRPPSKKSPVQKLLPRSIAKQNAENTYNNTPFVQWINKQFIEDGILIGGRSIKMIRIQTEVRT